MERAFLEQIEMGTGFGITTALPASNGECAPEAQPGPGDGTCRCCVETAGALDVERRLDGWSNRCALPAGASSSEGALHRLHRLHPSVSPGLSSGPARCTPGPARHTRSILAGPGQAPGSPPLLRPPRGINRRVKCDEVWPVCKRCQYNGRFCQRDQPPQGVESAVVMERSLRSPVMLDDVAHCALDYFFSCTLRNIEHFEPSPIWSDVVDRIQNDVAIRNAAAAIGRQQRIADLALIEPDTSTPDTADGQATLLYTRAISSLRQSIGHHPRTHGINYVLASLLLVILESLRGSAPNLLVHLHSGIRIVRELNARSSDPQQPFDDDKPAASALQECTRLLHQYGVNTMVFDPASESTRTTQQLVWETRNLDSSHGVPVHKSQDDDPDSKTCPDIIPSALSLDMPANEFQRHIKLTLRSMTSNLLRLMSMARGLSDPVADPIVGKFIESMKSTQRTAEKFITTRIEMVSVAPSVDADRYLSNLKFALAHCTLTKISLTAAWTGLQSSYDAELASFKKIVALNKEALALLQKANTRDGNHNIVLSAFSLGTSVVPVLMCVVRQCRDPETRREALSLFEQCPKHEGLWEAHKTRLICDAIIEFEERRAGGVVPIPEECRIHFYRFIAGDACHGGKGSGALEVALKPDAKQRKLVFETTAI
nr:hypothetical protein CFP56_11712 [Quercus suber]